METATVSWKCSGDKFTGDPLGSYGGGTGRQHNRRGQPAPPPPTPSGGVPGDPGDPYSVGEGVPHPHPTGGGAGPPAGRERAGGRRTTQVLWRGAWGRAGCPHPPDMRTSSVVLCLRGTRMIEICLWKIMCCN